MTITFISLSFLTLFTVLGYYRGLYRIIAILIALLIAGLLSKPFSPLLTWPIKLLDIVPLALIPLTAQIVIGLIIFLLLSSLFNRILKSNETGREQLNLPKIPYWQKYSGAIIGCTWGGFLLVFTMTGLHLGANIQEALLYKNSQIEIADSSGLSNTLVSIKEQIEESAFGDLVVQLDPVDEKVQEIFEDLSTVLTTPRFHQHFRNHPTISQLAEMPAIQELAQDPTIQYQIQNGQFYDLLDNPKILVLLNNDEIYYELKHVDIGTILKQVINDGHYY